MKTNLDQKAPREGDLFRSTTMQAWLFERGEWRELTGEELKRAWTPGPDGYLLKNWRDGK